MTAAHTCLARNRAGRIKTVVADARAQQSAPRLDMPQQPACRRYVTTDESAHMPMPSIQKMRGPPNGEPLLVAGAGFEPTTFGL